MKMTYYPGCSLTGTAKDYDESVRETAGLLDIDLVELQDWNCCGASSAHMTNHELAGGLARRNLELAEQSGIDLLVPCSACYSRLRMADWEIRQEPKRFDREDYQPDFEIVHISSLLSKPEILEKLKQSCTRKLTGLRVACYYGCLSSRPPKISGQKQYENPMGMDLVVEALGGEAVKWSHKTECCSGSLTMARPDISQALIGDIVRSAQKAGAVALVTDCPMCQANLESRQLDLAGESDFTTLPVFYPSELIAACLKERPDSRQWKGHLIDPSVLTQVLSTVQQPSDEGEVA